MSGIELKKKAAGIVIAKRKLEKLVCEVKFAIDVSGSMENFYNRGVVQELVDRMLAAATKFDDNGEMEMWVFSHTFKQLQTVDERQHVGFVKKHILNDKSVPKWGGTAYSPVMGDILMQSFFRQVAQPQLKPETAPVEKKGWFGGVLDKVKSALGQNTEVDEPVQIEQFKLEPHTPEFPILVPFITDGDNGDHSQTEALFKQYADKPIFWLMVGVGKESLTWLQKMANTYPNVGFKQIEDPTNMSDEEFYEALISTKFANWAQNLKK